MLSAFVSALVVMLAMYTTITERTREIGILKAMGASRGYIVGEIEKEAMLISVIGVVAGFAVSFVAGYLIQRAYGLLFEYSWTWGTDCRAHRTYWAARSARSTRRCAPRISMR